jgi:hypothetical protein
LSGPSWPCPPNLLGSVGSVTSKGYAVGADFKRLFELIRPEYHLQVILPQELMTENLHVFLVKVAPEGGFLPTVISAQIFTKSVQNCKIGSPKFSAPDENAHPRQLMQAAISAAVPE